MKKTMTVAAIAATASLGTVASAGTFGYTWDFNDSSAFVENNNGLGGNYDASGYGRGLVGRAGPSWPNNSARGDYAVDPSNAANGVMNYTAGGALSGFRTGLLNDTGRTIEEVRSEFAMNMAKEMRPTTSIDVYYGGADNSQMSGTGFFYTLATNNAGGRGSGGTYLAMGISNGMVNAGGGINPISMSVGWNTLSFAMNADGTVDYLLNGTLLRSTTSVFNYLANADDSAIGMYSLEETSMLLDNLTFGNLAVVPLPPAAWAGMVVLGGIVGVRKLRRR